MLEKVWKIASEFYHTETESNFFSNLILNYIDKDSRIIDVSCGTGFPVIYLLQNGFTNISCSDGYLMNIEFLKKELDSLGYHIDIRCTLFQELAKNYNEKFDLVFSIGTSITYCESWDESKVDTSLAREEILNSLEGMRSIVKEGGILIIGLSNLYDKEKTSDSIQFDDKIIDGTPYSMKWDIIYDWGNFKKIWFSKIYTSGKLVYDTKLISHLITPNEIKELCSPFFKSVIIISNPHMSSEDYIICNFKI